MGRQFQRQEDSHDSRAETPKAEQTAFGGQFSQRRKFSREAKRAERDKLELELSKSRHYPDRVDPNLKIIGDRRGADSFQTPVQTDKQTPNRKRHRANFEIDPDNSVTEVGPQRDIRDMLRSKT